MFQFVLETNIKQATSTMCQYKLNWKQLQ